METSATLQILISSSPINHHSHWSLITQNNSLYCHWAARAPGVILAAFLGHLSLIMQLMVTEMSRVHTMWTMTTITLATPGTHFLRWPNTEEDNHQFYALASFLRSNWYWYQQMHFTDKWITFKGREIKTIWYPTEKIPEQWVFCPYVECNKLGPSTPGVIISILVRLIAVTHILFAAPLSVYGIFSPSAICLHFISQTLQIRVPFWWCYCASHATQIYFRFSGELQTITACRFYLHKIFMYFSFLYSFPGASNKTVLYQPLPLVLIWALCLNNKKQWQLILISCLNITAPSSRVREESIREWKH